MIRRRGHIGGNVVNFPFRWMWQDFFQHVNMYIVHKTLNSYRHMKGNVIKQGIEENYCEVKVISTVYNFVVGECCSVPD